jgi:hypothetical protein
MLAYDVARAAQILGYHFIGPKPTTTRMALCQQN